MTRFGLLIGLLGLLGSAPSWALSTGERLTQLEQQVAAFRGQIDSLIALQSGDASGRQQTADSTLLQMQTLQQQLRDIQNQIDLLQNQSEAAQLAQKKQAEALERRVTLLEDRAIAPAQPPRSVPPISTRPIPVLGPQAVAATTSTAAQAAAPVGNEQADYDAAFALIKQGKYDNAISAFSNFAKNYPQSARVANAHYWTGEAQYILGRNEDAIKALQIVYNRYGNSDKAADALYKLASIYQEQQKNAQAIPLYRQVMSKYPDTRAAQQAKQKLDQLVPAKPTAQKKPAAS